jgi:hypothetical protein
VTAFKSVIAIAAKTVTPMSVTTVITGTIPAGLQRLQRSGNVVALS